MTKSKALKIIADAIDKKGEQQSVVLYYDEYAYKLDFLKELMRGNKHPIIDKHKHLCLKMTLKALSEVIEKDGVTANIGDNEHQMIASLVCREIEKDVEKFTRFNHLHEAYNEESLKKLDEYYAKNKKAIDKLLGA